MEIKESPLEIIDYGALNITFNSVLCDKKEEIDIYKYPIEIDFGLDESENNQKMLFIKVWSNFNDKPGPGYSFCVETATLFRIENAEELDEQTMNNLLTYTVLGIAYSNLRNIINNISNTGPYGRYILPSIDLQDLVSNKHKESQSNE